MRRRTLLAGIASASSIPAIAGCLGDDEGGDGGDDGSDGDDPQTGTFTPDIETVSQRELDDPSGDDRNVESTATVTRDGETVEIAGSLEAATPCHEAVVADVSVEDDTLTVRVELEESSDGVCAQQISEVEYEATIEIEEGDPTHLVVVHADRVGEETAADVEL